MVSLLIVFIIIAKPPLYKKPKSKKRPKGLYFL